MTESTKKGHNSRTHGTTLIELIVASAILATVTGIISLSLATVFDGYLMTQLSTSLDQDTQTIIRRLNYATTKHEERLILELPSREGFVSGATLIDTKLQMGAVPAERIVLEEGALSGVYTTREVQLASTEAILAVEMVGHVASTSSRLRYQIAGAKKDAEGVCPDLGVYVGPDTTTASFFEYGTRMPIPLVATGDFVNPLDCASLKIFFERAEVTKPSPELFKVIIKK